MCAEGLDRTTWSVELGEQTEPLFALVVTGAVGSVAGQRADFRTHDGPAAEDRVPGAQSSIVASGTVGFGASPTARNVSVTDVSVDLRTARNLAPSMPPVDGVVKGSATIASADLKQATVPQLDLLWTDAAGNPTSGTTAWLIGPADGKQFAPSKSTFMVNYRVEDLDALLQSLRDEGCNVLEKTDDSEYGKFGWVMDPEGNKVELWQPPAGQ